MTQRELARESAPIAAEYEYWLRALARLRGALVLAGVGVLVGALSLITRQMGSYSDEMYHVPQIQNFCHADFSLDGSITMLPGFHAVLALAGSALRDCSAPMLRSLNAALLVLVCWMALRILVTLHSRVAIPRALALSFLPLLFPYGFVVYTDVLALFLALWSLWLWLQRQHIAAGVVASVAVLVRQTDIAMPLLFVAMAWLERDRHLPLLAQARALLRTCWSSLLGMAAFAAFVLYNGGVAIGDQARHPLGIQVGNLYFTLFLIPVVAAAPSLFELWRRRRALASLLFAAALVASYLVYRHYFRVEHEYNLQHHFLHNDLLMWVVRHKRTRNLFFIPIALGLAIVWTSAWSRAAFRVWLPLSAAMLVPESLIEPRYALLPIALFMLMRKDSSPYAEVAGAACNAVLSVTLVLMMARAGLQL
jgi:alpha-1,2-glucosyltransferase